MANLYRHLKERDGFKPCPICESLDEVEMTTSSLFHELHEEHGFYLVHVFCKRCSLDLWGHDCTAKQYKTHVEYVRQRWNKMWTRGQMEGEKDVTLH